MTNTRSQHTIIPLPYHHPPTASMKSSHIDSPFVDALPNEIVLHVIKLAIPTASTGSPADLPNDLTQSNGSSIPVSGDVIFTADTTSRLYTTYAYRICAVNHRIRNLVLGDPSFWRQIIIHPRTTLNEVKLWVERSQRQPLDISIYVVSRSQRMYHHIPFASDERNNTEYSLLTPTCSEPMYATSARVIFSMLETHSIRWGSLTIVTPCERDMSFFTQRLATVEQAPSLRKLYLLNAIQCDYETHLHINDDIHTPFKGNYPLLTDISLTGSPVFVNLPQRSVASKFDSFYRCDILHLSEVSTTLTRIQMVSSTLTRLSITTFGFQSLPVVAGTICIPNLKHLDITFWGADELIPIVEVLHLPKLRVLGVMFGDGEADNFWDQIRTCTGKLPTLFNQITTLITADFPCTQRQANCLIVALPRLENLVIRKRVIDESPIFRCLAKFVDLDRPPCPKLTNILCVDARPKGIRDLVTNRKAMGVPLTSFHVSVQNALRDRDITWLKQNIHFTQHQTSYLS